MEDESRFRLKCGHPSKHLNCMVSSIALEKYGVDYTYCPIADTPQCKRFVSSGKFGEQFFWDQKDYHNFFQAFLRNEKLSKTFIKKSCLSPSPHEPEAWKESRTQSFPEYIELTN